MKKLKLILLAVVVVCTMCVLAVVASADDYSGTGDGYTWTYDATTNKATITVNTYNNVLGTSEANRLLSTWGEQIKTIEFIAGNTNKLVGPGRGKTGNIVGLPKLEAIIIDSKFVEFQQVYVQDNPMLKTFGPSGTEPGTLDLSRFSKINGGANFGAWQFQNNPLFTKLVLPASGVVQLGEETFMNCTGITEIVIPQTCAISKFSLTLGEDRHPFNGLTQPVTIYNNAANTTTANLLLGYLPEGSTIYVEDKPTSGSSTYADYVYDEATGKATITIKGWGDALSQTGWIDIVNAWKDDITTIEFVSTNNVTKLESTRSLDSEEINIKAGAIVGFPNLETIIVDAKFTDLTYIYIQNNPNLKTFGPSGTEEGTLDLSQIVKMNNGGTTLGAWNFKGNPSFTKLVLPASGIVTLGEEAFKDCTGITEIVIPETCAITGFSLTLGNDKHSFCGLTQPVTIYNEMANDTLAQNILALLPADSVIKEKIDPSKFNKSITFEGWSVRTAVYNGLRGLFSHDKTVENDDWTLAEYGALLATSSNKNVGGVEVTYDIATNESSFESYVFPFPICVTGEDGLERTNNLILSTSNKYRTDFAVSIIKYQYKSHYTTDVYMAGYEIWVKDGEYIVLYTDYSDLNDDDTYVDTNIYEVSLGMYKSGFMNAENDANNIVWDSLVEGGALELTKGTDYTTTDDYTDGEAINMKTGEPFGDTFTVANVPLVNQAREDVDGVDTLVFTDAGTTYTILKDCFNEGKYVLVYRDDRIDENGTEIPGADLEKGYRGQIYSKWYTDWAVTRAEKVSASRPNPVYASSVYSNCETVIIDHGITGTGMQAFGHSGGVTFMYHETFKNIASATWLDATKVTTIYLAQPNNKDFVPEEGLADISSVDSVDPAILFKSTKITAVHMPDSSKWVKDENGNRSVTKEFAQKTAINTLWCGDGSRTDGVIDLSNTDVVTIGANAFNENTAVTTVKLPATANSIDDSAFTATSLTIDHGTAYSGTIATYCDSKGYTYNAGTPVAEASTGWSGVVF